MTRQIVFHEMAEEELNDAAHFYESEVKGLGQTFLNEVEKTVLHIQQYPVAAPFILDIIRRKPMHQFPYSIMYSYDDNIIRILAVANQKRRPLYWRKRK